MTRTLNFKPGLAGTGTVDSAQRRQSRTHMCVCSLILSMLFFLAEVAPGQVMDQNWTNPTRMSSLDADLPGLGTRSLVVDGSDHCHLFWLEWWGTEKRYVLLYSRFDGATWSPPLLLDEVGNIWPGYMTALDATVSAQGQLHVNWGGNWGPVWHRYVDVERSLDLGYWSQKNTYNIPAHRRRMYVDSAGTYHLFYLKYPGSEPQGVFYQRSTNAGAAWSTPVNLDTGLLPGQVAEYLETDFDGGGGLYVVWSRRTGANWYSDSIHYVHSLNGGDTWTAPFLVDKPSSGIPDEVRLPYPSVRVREATVVISWAGGGVSNVGRRYMYSLDSGHSWTPPEQLFHGLYGQAGGDGVAFDSKGRLHFLAQIRYPQGLYHASWQGGQWSTPEMIYLIAQDAHDPMGPRIHAHEPNLVITNGNQLVATIQTQGSNKDTSTVSDHRVLFAMNTKLSTGDPGSFATVSAASFTAGQPLAAGVIAAGFGQNLAEATEIAPASGGLPQVLADTSVIVRDSTGIERSAPLWFVSPSQINYLVPEDTALGQAVVTVSRKSQVIAMGPLQIDPVAPGLFTMNFDGTGVAAGRAIVAKPDGTQTWQYVFNSGCQPGSCQPIPIDFGASTDQVFLELYGTGVRGLSSLAGATAQIGGVDAQVEYAGPVAGLIGLDQINVRVPRTLAGRGEVDVVITIDGRRANSVKLNFR